MADLDEFERAASAFPDLDDIGGDVPSGGRGSFPALDGDDDGFGSFENDGLSFSQLNKSQPSVRVTGNEEIEKFEGQFPDIGGAASYAPPPTSSQPSFYQSPPIQQPAYGGPIYAPQVLEEESGPIKNWREEHEERIRERDAQSQRKKQATMDKARDDIDNFYETYNKKKERNIADNKRTEEEYKDQLTDSLAAGTTWERICEMIELSNSQSKTTARAGAGTSDLSRMKEVFLRLKREGENAPGAAGY